jgi:hypothetical protein
MFQTEATTNLKFLQFGNLKLIQVHPKDKNAIRKFKETLINVPVVKGQILPINSKEMIDKFIENDIIKPFEMHDEFAPGTMQILDENNNFHGIIILAHTNKTVNINGKEVRLVRIASRPKMQASSIVFLGCLKKVLANCATYYYQKNLLNYSIMLNKHTELILFGIEKCNAIVIDKIIARNDIFNYNVELLCLIGEELKQYYQETNAMRASELLIKSGAKEEIMKTIEKLIFYSKL